MPTKQSLGFLYSLALVTYQTSVSRRSTHPSTHARYTPLIFLLFPEIITSWLDRDTSLDYVRAHMGEVVGSTVAAAVKEEEERYVKVTSRFFREKPATGADHHHHHFLDSCFLCKKSISSDRDIFMYNGDAAFCDEECRQEQMAMDEALRAVARRQRVRPRHKPAAVDATARREVAATTAPPMMHRRPTIANLGAARTPVAAS